MRLMEFPPGFRFFPSDNDLIYFLNEKVNFGQTTSESMEECDMYGNKEPWEIWNDHGGLNVDQEADLYLFTKLKKVSVNGKRINRRVGSGTWSGANCGEVVDGVGVKRHFRYENNGGRDHGAWIMHEYSLLHNHSHAVHGDGEYVLCRLRRKINGEGSSSRGGKRRKLMNDNIIQQQEDQTRYHHQELNIINNPTQKLDDLKFPNDIDDTGKLMEYHMNLEEQVKWSLSSSNTDIDGGASSTAVGFDDLCDWGVCFAEDHDDDELMEISAEEFHIHKSSSSSSTVGAEEKTTTKSTINDDHAVVEVEEDDQDEMLDKFAKKLEEDMLAQLEIVHEVEGDDQQEVVGIGHEVEDDDHNEEFDQFAEMLEKDMLGLEVEEMMIDNKR